MRAALARPAPVEASLLLLDEPTNHLDLESLAWLESFLASYEGNRGGVSHDRYFLNRMVSSIARLGLAALRCIRVTTTITWSSVSAARAPGRAGAQSGEAALRDRALIERFRYQATKARQVQSRIKMLERIDRVEWRRSRVGSTSRFGAAADGPPGCVAARHPQGVRRPRGLRLASISTSSGAKGLRSSGSMGPANRRCCVSSPASCRVDRGERTLGAHVVAHYYAQHQLDALDPSRSVLEELEVGGTRRRPHALRTILGSFLFSGRQPSTRRSRWLSGGEKARLALAKMLTRPAALLCLDEPTNHLDLVSREVSRPRSPGFRGPSCSCSHDRYFINASRTSVVEVAEGRLSPISVTMTTTSRPRRG